MPGPNRDWIDEHAAQVAGQQIARTNEHRRHVEDHLAHVLAMHQFVLAELETLATRLRISYGMPERERTDAFDLHYIAGWCEHEFEFSFSGSPVFERSLRDAITSSDCVQNCQRVPTFRLSGKQEFVWRSYKCDEALRAPGLVFWSEDRIYARPSLVRKTTSVLRGSAWKDASREEELVRRVEFSRLTSRELDMLIRFAVTGEPFEMKEMAFGTVVVQPRR